MCIRDRGEGYVEGGRPVDPLGPVARVDPDLGVPACPQDREHAVRLWCGTRVARYEGHLLGVGSDQAVRRAEHEVAAGGGDHARGAEVGAPALDEEHPADDGDAVEVLPDAGGGGRYPGDARLHGGRSGNRRRRR